MKILIFSLIASNSLRNYLKDNITWELNSELLLFWLVRQSLHHLLKSIDALENLGRLCLSFTDISITIEEKPQEKPIAGN